MLSVSCISFPGVTRGPERKNLAPPKIWTTNKLPGEGSAGGEADKEEKLASQTLGVTEQNIETSPV